MHYFLNGRILQDNSPGISISDRGFLLGDGLFETFKIIDKRPMFLTEHLQRLSHGANLLAIPYTITEQQISNILSELINLNKTDGMLSARLTLTRGIGPRGILPPKEIMPTVLLTLSPYIPTTAHPYSLWVASNRRNEYSPISRIKSIAYTDNILGRIEASKNGADDALFLNTQNNVTSTSMCNIFLIKNDSLITPALSDGILPGIIRAQIIAIAKKLGISCTERSIALEECYTSDGMFLTNSLIEIKPVQVINQQLIKQHPSMLASLSKELTLFQCHDMIIFLSYQQPS